MAAVAVGVLHTVAGGRAVAVWGMMDHPDSHTAAGLGTLPAENKCMPAAAGPAADMPLAVERKCAAAAESQTAADKASVLEPADIPDPLGDNPGPRRYVRGLVREDIRNCTEVVVPILYKKNKHRRTIRNSSRNSGNSFALTVKPQMCQLKKFKMLETASKKEGSRLCVANYG